MGVQRLDQLGCVLLSSVSSKSAELSRSKEKRFKALNED